MGGVLKYYLIYSLFIGFMNKLRLDLAYLRKNIAVIHKDVNKYHEIKRIIHELKIFHLALNKNKSMERSFELKGKQFQLEEYMFQVLKEYKRIKCIFELGKHFSKESKTKTEFESKQSHNADMISLYHENNIAIYDAFNSNCDILQTNVKYYLHMNLKTLLFQFKYLNVFHHLYQRIFLQFNSHHVQTLKINNNLEGLLITPKEAIKNDTLVIVSNQNAVCMESYALSAENINLYLNLQNVSILLWNFRGYGTRKGTPSFSNIKDDSEEIFKYFFTDKRLNFTKFIFHGISLGGFAACHMAKLYSKNDKNNVLLIADRTFSSINHIVKLLPFGSYLEKLYWILFPQWYDDSSCVESYLQTKNKIILYDENDEMIYEKANLNFGMSQLLYERMIIPQLRKCLTEIANKPSKRVSTILFTKHQIEALENSLIKIKTNPDLNKRLLCYKYIISKISSSPLHFKSSLESFLFKLFIYGYPFNQECEILPTDHSFSPTFIYKQCILLLHTLYIETSERKGDFSDCEEEYFVLLQFIKSVRNVYIQCFVDDSCKISLGEDKEEAFDGVYEIKEEIKSGLIEKIGFVKKITCGHNGSLRIQEMKFLENFLLSMELI